MADVAPTEPAGARHERGALLESAVAAAVLGTAAVVAGLASRSAVVLFDGLYTLAGIALVGVSALASRAATSRPGGRYPFGRHAATPLAVVVQGAALIATLLYGAADAVGTLLAGGSDADPTTMLAYGGASAVVSALVAWRLRRRSGDSALVDAEVVSWWAGAAISLAVGLGGVVAAVLAAGGRDGAAGYVDPVLLLVVVLLVARLPVRLLRDGTHELLEGAPPPEVDAAVRAAVETVRAAFDLPAPLVRATKLGRRLYVEVDFVVRPGRWDVDAEDEVRRAVVSRLRDLPLDVWATVELTADPGLAG